jgi:TBC1 domain family protein 5
MHELLAVCFLAVDRDSLESSGSTPLSPLAENRGMKEAMTATLDRRYIEQDAFGLFQEVMRGAKPFYEWRAEEGPVRSPSVLGSPLMRR